MRPAAAHRVAVLAHGHPALSAGGAEIAAQALHDALTRLPGVGSLHVSCVPRGHPLAVSNPSGARKPNERFVETALLDPLRLSSRDPADLADLLTILRGFDPHTIHLHHVLGFGADALFALRQTLPKAALVMTLHEFVPICHRQGQMVKTDASLCTRASPAACNACFPEISPKRFLLRERSLQALLSLVDQFVAPSAFLAGRYAEWGLPREKISVLENVVAPAPALGANDHRSERRRFAFFGQLTPFKGVDVLLDAVASLSDEEWQGCSLDIFGGGLDRQPQDFQRSLAARLENGGVRVRHHGAYANADLPALMAEIDWVVVPSIWWENSPVVIQEAFRGGRPVIASDIGGMAEKIRDGIDGLSFRVGDASALADCLLAARSEALWQKLVAAICPPVAPQVTARDHLAIYRKLRASRRRPIRPSATPELLHGAHA